MNLTKCPNGHFYDAAKFQHCPHCTGVQNPDRKAGDSSDRDLKTVALNTDTDADVKTVAMNVETAMDAINAQGVLNAASHMNGVNHLNPANAMNADDEDVKTVPLQSSYAAPVQAPGFPPVQPMPVSGNRSQDDDVETVGYYQTDSAAPVTGQKRIAPVVGWLVVTNGSERGRSYTLKAGKNFIGRGTSNDVVLSGDNTVSREKHAIVIFEPHAQSFLLQPGTSNELFYVNDEVVLETRPVKAYDVLSIGKTTLVFVPFCGESFSWESAEEA